ncbi:MAG: ABC transporter substrate-binding protein [Lautropia sp.]|nr:MAG: ABC transporter substrate-binding protein [Pseudomonadota bacterium]MBC6958905.1 ABC transporter substrate-binding protein [Lautropia sp.]MDL1907920.1 ABC transporter substrate-binding protein [Betaproteobacteria bacterium PRO1]RIK90442.1 MAG: ABC transporter substrate-binding protein [Burkholderiales bacterium]
MTIVARVALALTLGALAGPALAAHALAWGDAPKYPPGFAHFDYVNPQAPRGGTLSLAGYGSFDKLNPFTLRGLAAAGLGTLMFETLAVSSEDEPFSMYGLLADDIRFAEDALSITFHLNPRARFWNGDPVTAEDVRHSFEVLTGRQAHPRFRQYFADVARVVVVDMATVRFEFARRNHELHMIIGMQLPVFSRKWGAGQPFDSVVQDEPLTSGPYRIERFDWGRTITYRRDPAWWAADLNVRRGMFNFERVVYKYFKDETARLEGFKAGEFDWVAENSAKNWARGHTGRHYDSGEIVKREFRHSNSAGMQGFVLNTRRPAFADVRVRQALALAMDFEWMNRQVFYGQYVRSPSYFTNSEMEAKGLPSADELALLEPLRAQLDAAVFGEAVMPPTTDPPSSLRANLRRALALLAEAGWKVDGEGVLRNARGQAFGFEILSYSKGLERIAVPWARNLGKLGIAARLRITDPALYQKRMDEFDFDVAIHLYAASQTPGNELLERFSSTAADGKGSDNFAGIRDRAVDAIVQRLLASRTRAELVTAARALDRVLRAGWYLVPHFYAPTHRVAWRARLAHPDTLPLYYAAETWLLETWWEKR